MFNKLEANNAKTILGIYFNFLKKAILKIIKEVVYAATKNNFNCILAKQLAMDEFPIIY